MVFELKGYEFWGLIIFCIIIGLVMGVQYSDKEHLEELDFWAEVIMEEGWDAGCFHYDFLLESELNMTNETLIKMCLNKADEIRGREPMYDLNLEAKQ